MNNNFATLHYKKTDKMSIVPPDDTNSVVLNCYEELLKSITTFQNNIEPSTQSYKKKSSSFAKALTILYTLQSSIDFEKDLKIAKNLFQIYEYTRQALINEFKSCKIEKSALAFSALTEIRDSWQKII